MLHDKRMQKIGRRLPQPARVAGLAGALFASLCCSGPLLLAAVGAVSIPVAGALATKLFYGYWPLFVGGGVTVALGALALAYRRGAVCAVELPDRRRQLVNAVLATLVVFAIAYLIWDFVIVEISGIIMGLWRSPIA